MDNSQKKYDANQTAKMLGVTTNTIYKLSASGKLKYTRVGVRKYFSKDVIDLYIEKHVKTNLKHYKGKKYSVTEVSLLLGNSTKHIRHMTKSGIIKSIESLKPDYFYSVQNIKEYLDSRHYNEKFKRAYNVGAICLPDLKDPIYIIDSLSKDNQYFVFCRNTEIAFNVVGNKVVQKVFGEKLRSAILKLGFDC